MPPTAELERAILYTLAYADVFDFPLTPDEIHYYLAGVPACLERVNEALGASSLWACVDGYYLLPGREAILGMRRRRAEAALRLWPQAMRYGRLIASLPFVRMVAVTGSLAVNNAEDGTDIDFLMVTAPGHLWTCRALALVVSRFARLARANLCPNYLLTETNLELTDRTLYVARELVQMIPLSGWDVYARMRELNSWTNEFLPNATSLPESPREADRLRVPTRLQRMLESLLKTGAARRFENWEMRRKIERFSREQAGSPEAVFSREVCKGHADRHGQQTEQAFHAKLKELPLEALT
jgi:hypothetical protein